MWSFAAETALADACRFAGGPVPERGLIMGRGTARMRVVRLAHEGGDVFMHRDSSSTAFFCLTLGVGLRRSWIYSMR